MLNAFTLKKSAIFFGWYITLMRIIAFGWIFFGLISRMIDFNLKIILASAKLFKKPSVSLWTEQVLNFAPLLFI